MFLRLRFLGFVACASVACLLACCTDVAECEWVRNSWETYHHGSSAGVQMNQREQKGLTGGTLVVRNGGRGRDSKRDRVRRKKKVEEEATKAERGGIEEEEEKEEEKSSRVESSLERTV